MDAGERYYLKKLPSPTNNGRTLTPHRHIQNYQSFAHAVLVSVLLFRRGHLYSCCSLLTWGAQAEKPTGRARLRLALLLLLYFCGSMEARK